jgi:hypothetical protein
MKNETSNNNETGNLQQGTVRRMCSFKYKGMIFHNVKDDLFQTDRFGDKLIYKYENEKYHLVKDERLSSIIPLEVHSSNNPQSYINDDNNWK